MNLKRIETDYWEDRHYENEADKRSQQFRVLADAINYNAEEQEKDNMFELPKLTWKQKIVAGLIIAFFFAVGFNLPR